MHTTTRQGIPHIRTRARTHTQTHAHKYVIGLLIAFPQQQWFTNVPQRYVMRTLPVLLANNMKSDSILQRHWAPKTEAGSKSACQLRRFLYLFFAHPWVLNRKQYEFSWVLKVFCRQIGHCSAGGIHPGSSLQQDVVLLTVRSPASTKFSLQCAECFMMALLMRYKIDIDNRAILFIHMDIFTHCLCFTLKIYQFDSYICLFRQYQYVSFRIYLIENTLHALLDCWLLQM